MGLKDGMSVSFVALPDDLASLASVIAFEMSEKFSEWKELSGFREKYDIIRAFTKSAVELDLGDVKVCAANDSGSGLKLVIRKERR